MNEELSDLLKEFQPGDVNSENEIVSAESVLGTRLPDEYRAFLTDVGPGEGFVGEQYLIVWGANDLKQFNEDYEVKAYAPGLLLFASNGGGEGFAFDLRDEGKATRRDPGRSIFCSFSQWLRGELPE